MAAVEEEEGGVVEGPVQHIAVPSAQNALPPLYLVNYVVTGKNLPAAGAEWPQEMLVGDRFQLGRPVLLE